MTRILGLETSCDETAAAVVEDGRRVLGNVVWSQHQLHRRFRGVVPEIASRAHLEKITPVLAEAIEQAAMRLDRIDAVAVGNRPGLIGSLIVGVSAAKTLAWALDKPLIGIDHVQAHLHAARLSTGQAAAPAIEPPPHLGLVVSGGHTSLYEIQGATDLRLLGRTIDDAVGEAYDKAAVILDLEYPGGPAIDKLAQTGDPDAYDLPRSTMERDSLDFSFSGLKTALLYTVRGRPQGRGKKAVFPRTTADLDDRQRRDLAASFQAAAVDALIIKIGRALNQLTEAGRTPHSLVIGGGVSANSLLRRRVEQFGCEHGLPVHIPDPPFCMDNAAMIAALAYSHFQALQFDDLDLPAITTAQV